MPCNNSRSKPTSVSRSLRKRRTTGLGGLAGTLLALGVALTWPSLARSDVPFAAPPPSNVVTLEASASAQVSQDWLSITLSTTKDGADAAAVQAQLKQAIDSGLAVAKAAAQPGLLQARTGQFSLYPRYSSAGKINGWQGTAELVLDGRDFARISAAAGKMTALTVGQVLFSLSPEALQRLESEVQAQAIARFQERAGEVARAFGFKQFTLRQMSVGSADAGGGPERPLMRAMQAKSSLADAPVPVEAGQSTVRVSVSGDIQMN